MNSVVKVFFLVLAIDLAALVVVFYHIYFVQANGEFKDARQDLVVEFEENDPLRKYAQVHQDILSGKRVSKILRWKEFYDFFVTFFFGSNVHL